MSLDWAVHRDVWRGQALYIRRLFDAQRDVKDFKSQRVSADGGFRASSR
jgi:NADH dehydrogenase (ubiquinone) 1 beta subcomplex subunit 9